jgi:hypothetical protein
MTKRRSRASEIAEHFRSHSRRSPDVNRIVVKSRVGSNGILQLTLPVGSAEAGQEVQITVEPVGPRTLSTDEWRQRILETAGKWQGEFERPEQGEYEQREPLS